ncbi:MAG: hypothetical protein AB7P18_11575 [Candidatus Binatia bacterium]
MMLRKMRINNIDMDCRYLDAQLFLPPITGHVADGRLGHYLKSILDITKLPYRISLVDLIREKVVELDLFVLLPRKYFLNYENFPQRQAKFVPGLNKAVEIASYHSVNIVLVPGETSSLKDLLHPYDQEKWKTDFVEKFLSRVPDTLRYKAHPNGHKFAPYEAYLNYWRAYTFVEALNGYENIENFLPPRKGRSIMMARFAKVSKRWEDSYKEIFARVSFYRTAHAILNSSLDSLLVISIRTEILIRSIFEKIVDPNAPDDLINIFKGFENQCPKKSKDRSILGRVTDKQNWDLTKLSKKPPDIFGRIDLLSRSCGWSSFMHDIFKTVLRFVTARNYFAHHLKMSPSTIRLVS